MEITVGLSMTLFIPTNHVIILSLGLYLPSFSAQEARLKFILFLETQIYLQTPLLPHLSFTARDILFLSRRNPYPPLWP